MSLDLPTFTNGGLIVLGLLILALVAMLAPHPCPWRCPDCAARFPRLEQLLAHEARHRHPAYLPTLGTPAPLNPAESARLDELIADLTKEN